MIARRILAAAVLALGAVITSGCAGASAPAPTSGTVVLVPTPDPTSSPELVATAFATAYAAGDTPLACTYTTGSALDSLTSSGLCAASQWTPQGYWAGNHCEYMSALYDSMGRYGFIYLTNGRVAGGEAFAVGVSGTGTSWHVSYVGAGDKAAVQQLCSGQITTTSPRTTG